MKPCCGTCKWAKYKDWSKNPEILCRNGDSIYFDYCVDPDAICPDWEGTKYRKAYRREEPARAD